MSSTSYKHFAVTYLSCIAHHTMSVLSLHVSPPERTTAAQPLGRSLLSLAFRPFDLVAVMFALLATPLWAAATVGSVAFAIYLFIYTPRLHKPLFIGKDV